MKTAAQVIEKFTADVHKAVRKHWPKLVAVATLDAGDELLHDELEAKRSPRERPIALAQSSTEYNLKDPKTYIDTLAIFGSKCAAARGLGIPETTFRERLKKALAQAA